MRVPNTIKAAGLVLALSSVLILAGSVPAASQTATVSTVHSFTGGTDGANPTGLMQTADGTFYGTTSNFFTIGSGTIFKITTASKFTTFYTFSGSDGSWPFAGLIQASDSAFYGTTDIGGSYGSGTVFRITKSSALTTLYSFNDASNSAYQPDTTLIQATDGNLYGTTERGGTSDAGTIFRITTSGKFTMLHSFSGGTDGSGPCRTLIQASNDNLYGTTAGGGAFGYGTVFRISTSGALTTLYSFSGGSDGFSPADGVIQASDGNLYGATYSTVFRMSTSGSLTTIYNFKLGADGYAPNAIMQAPDGNLYATAEYGGANQSGTIFRVTLSGALTTLLSIDGSFGVHPEGLMQAGDGNLYGVCWTGGPTGYGTVYRLSGTYPVPVLTGISPSSANAAGPAFALKVTGFAFQTFSTVNWNGSTLKTTYVSPTELTASIPASFIATAGKPKVTVVTPAGGGTSGSKTFALLATTLKLKAAKLTRDTSKNTLTAVVTLSNMGFLSANSTSVTKATLNGTSATNLPQSAGSIPAGITATATLLFPDSAGSSGQKVTMKLSGMFAGGTFSGSLNVKLP